MYNKYPYTDLHELNLDMILKRMKQLEIEFEEFEVVNKITFSGAWDITKQYPAWTIVSDNNVGYVSIQPVPAGVLLTNGDYWRAVIDYTAQIAGLQTRVVALENTVGDASSGLVKDVDDLQTTVGDASTGLVKDVNDLETAVNNLENKVYKKYAFITDSYGDPSVSDDNTSIITHFINMMGLTNNVDIAYTYQGGAGFVSDGVRLFSTLLTNLYNTIESSAVAFDADQVTDLIVVGGDNDSAFLFSPIYTAIETFVASAKTYFPNATIHIGEVGNVGLTRSTNHANIGLYTVPAYQACTNIGCHYLTGTELVMRNRSLLMSDDVHPTGAGMKQIAGAIKQALITAYDVTYEEESVNMNLTNNNIGSTSSTITARIRRKKDITQLFIAGYVDVPGGTLAANTNLILGTIESNLIDGFGYSKGLGWVQNGLSGPDSASLFNIVNRQLVIRLPDTMSATAINMNNVVLTVDSALI